MTEHEFLQQTEGAYLWLIHPRITDERIRLEIGGVIQLAPRVPHDVLSSMLCGDSWRERLLALCAATATSPQSFTEPMLNSLRDPRGIAIVPACAALAVLAEKDMFSVPAAFASMFDREAFDGEVGWATDKVMKFAGFNVSEVPGLGPNFGQNFDDHVGFYRWICKV